MGERMRVESMKRKHGGDSEKERSGLRKGKYGEKTGRGEGNGGEKWDREKRKGWMKRKQEVGGVGDTEWTRVYQ